MCICCISLINNASPSRSGTTQMILKMLLRGRLALSHGLSHSLLILLLCIFGQIGVYNYQCVFLIDLLMEQRENRADAKSIAVGREPTTVRSVWLYSFLQLQLQHSTLAYTAYGPSIPGNWKPISVHLNRFMLPSVGPRMSRLQYMHVSWYRGQS